MLAELRFVQGSVARKDFLPALTHFCIEKGTVRGYNGIIALSSPIPFDIDCKPKGDQLIKAIRNCNETIALSMTKAGRLNVKSGAFKAFIECIEGETSHVEPEGEHIEINGAVMLAALKSTSPFIADDASRPWANGVLIKGQSLFATNNVILVEYWTGFDFPVVVNLPRQAIKEILRIDEAPDYAQVTETSMTFHYSNKRWIRTQLLSTEWPDLSKVLERESKQEPVPEGLFQGLENIAPFVDKMGRVIFHEGTVRTTLVEGEGASCDVDGLTYSG
ncbi:MAG TPA: hypothetical protein VJ044_01120, partial [Candidatus Hodarchaeales archaeon]|nr:hypothetical protein [Candidatus Hodarchaeales archaeon]